MTRPITSSRVLLLPRPNSPESAVAPIRRYRLARVQVNGRAATPAQRFEHLKRVHD